MKECPNCKKKISEQTKVCPYCGKEIGYQRIQKGQKRITKRRSVLAIVATFVISSMISVYFLFDDDYFSELALYLDDDTFATLNEGDEEYIEAIASFESGLQNTLGDEISISKSYSFSGSSGDYAYFYPVYSIAFGDTAMKLEIEYDLASDNDYVEVFYTIGEFTSFEEMVDALMVEEYFMSVIDYFSADEYLISETVEAFVNLEEEFEEKKDVIGNYGIQVDSSNDSSQCMIVITQSGEGYYLKQLWTGLFEDDIF
ncbi:zinc ribbon domain-containing protein [Tannockella kyphosi]|uniref:zinc ribbon domain-containing protein n=1 Tax=Tannockella kyphosi TaxID=2899121 RepID=UPI002011BA1E|nr:zinc ribbon domain-containing protein [Tannockella kyphosi]